MPDILRDWLPQAVFLYHGVEYLVCSLAWYMTSWQCCTRPHTLSLSLSLLCEQTVQELQHWQSHTAITAVGLTNIDRTCVFVVYKYYR